MRDRMDDASGRPASDRRPGDNRSAIQPIAPGEEQGARCRAAWVGKRTCARQARRARSWFAFSGRLLPFASSLLLLLLLAGCGGGSSTSSGGASPQGTRLEFWHTRTRHQEAVLKQIIEEFNAKSGGPPIVPVYVPDYQDVRVKVLAGIPAKRLPLLAVCYENQVQEYMANDIVRPLDDFVNDPKEGLSKQDQDDFHPQFLETNRFAKYGNQLLSFPFTKSLLLLAYNKTLLGQVGFSKPPETWDEFQQQARAAKQQTGRTPLPFVVDASTIDGMIFSHGGEIISADGKNSLFDQQPTVRTLALLRELAREKLLTVTPGRNTAGLFGSGNVPFLLGTSSGRSNLEDQVQGRFDWDVAVIPHAPGVEPVTAFYGPNVCVFRSTPENERLAWRFIRQFTTAEVTARWSRETGYLPVRKSAAELAEMQTFFRENPRALHANEILPRSKLEPTVPGWDEVRAKIQDAATKAIQDQGTPEEIARQLRRDADATLMGGR